MACVSATSLLLLLLASFSAHQILARESQFFNKVTTPNGEQQEPTFLPQNENGYGLYGHESAQLPPAATTTTEPQEPSAFREEPVHKYLPKNYNPVAYVTEPEDGTASSVSGATSLAENTFDANNYQQQEYGAGEPQYRNNDNYQQQEYGAGEPQYRNNDNYQQQQYGTGEPRYRTNDNYYGGGSSFNSDNRRRGENYHYNGGSAFQPQGMSDTRSLENGKYFYDLNTGKYSDNHPYESLKGVGEYNDINSYANSETGARGYQNQQYEQFQDESSLP